MEAGLPLILLPGLGSLQALEGLRGLFPPPFSKPADVSTGLSSFIVGRQHQAVTWPLPLPKKPA